MRVFKLGIPDGTFETSPISTPHYRRFGFCSVRWPAIGDLVTIDRTTHKVLYQITKVNSNAPSRYEDVPEYRFFTGEMRDVLASRTATNEMNAALEAAGAL